MDMKIDSTAVKVLLKKKLWSQQELATACGLSLRTIQRLENEGLASADTMKALAAVFEVGYESLDGNDETSSTYVNIQMGYYLILLFFAVVVGLTVRQCLFWRQWPRCSQH